MSQAAKAAAKQETAAKQPKNSDAPKVVTPEKKVMASPTVEKAAPTQQPTASRTFFAPCSQPAAVSVDSWFAAQRRDLECISKRMHGSPMVKADPTGTPPSMKDWAKEHQPEVPAKKQSLLAASFGAKTKAPPKATQTSTTERDFDMWIERRRAELSTIAGGVDQAAAVPVSVEQWRAKLDAASEETLAKWKATATEDTATIGTGSLREASKVANQSLKELNFSLNQMQLASDNHQQALKQNELSIEHVQWNKLNNLTTNMSDRIHSIA